MKKVLILNLGLKSIRSIVFDENGNKLGTAALPLTTQLNEAEVMQDPKEWWAKAATVIRASLRNLNDRSIDIISITASSSCLVPVDENCCALGRCIMVSDKRAKDESNQISACSDFASVQEKTGLIMDSYLMLPKILWIKHNQPDIFAQTHKFLSPNDFLIGKMTGEYVTDVFNAQKYHYNANSHTYPTELLNYLGISEAQLPQVLPVGSPVASLLSGSADYLGLNTNAMVYVTTYDAICSFFGSGVASEGDASDASGTVTAFRALTYKNELKQSHKIFSTPFPEWNMHIVGGSNNLGGGLAEWVKQCYYFNEQYPYEIMEKEAKEVSIGAGGLVFLPYLMGERAPIWDCDARGVFFGLERTHTRRDMTRAVFESAAFIDRDMITAIEETGVHITRVKLSGGFARNLLIAQIKADVTRKPIDILDDFETTAIGSAMLALIGAGAFTTLQEAVDRFVKIRMMIIPNEPNSMCYDEIYSLYKETYLTVKDLFKARKLIVDKLYTTKEILLENL